MATKKTKNTKTKKATKSESKVTVTRPSKTAAATTDKSFLSQVQSDLENRNALLNVILGILIVIIVAVLIFNYFNRAKDLGPSSNTDATTTTQGDVTKENLPGNYTVKAGDTLFTIAEKYYDSGWEYTRIADANNLTNENNISEGQVLMIPKPDGQTTEASPSPATDSAMISSPAPTEASATPSIAPQTTTTNTAPAFGNKIDTDTYTVQAGDWLSTIAARAYNGDLMAYEKVAKANNLTNPNVIEVGQVLKLPR